MAEERVLRFSLRSVAAVIGLIVAAWLAIHLIDVAAGVLSWILIAVFFALALNPAVEWLMRHGVERRGLAVAVTYFAALLLIAAIGATFIPTLIREINDFVQAIPGYVDDLTKGRGRLGFLQTEYQIVDRVKELVEKGDAVAKLFGLSGAAISITKSVVTIVVGIITILFLTFFMLLEGPMWMERLYSLLPEEKQPRWRKVGADIYRTIGGYVTGNLFISLIAGTLSTVLLLILGVPYAVALGLLVAILDLIPLAGATLAAIIVSAVAFIDSLPSGIIVFLFFVVYQQVENHLIQPLVYGRTVQLPLAVLVAVLIGAKLAGVLGALAAIPTAGAIQVLILDWRHHRSARIVEGTGVALPQQATET